MCRVLGQDPRREAAAVLPRLGFLAQDHPLYKGFTVAETLKLGRKLNPGWDEALARRPHREPRPAPREEGGQALGRSAGAGGADPRAREAPRGAAARRARRLARSARAARVPAVGDGGGRRDRHERHALVAHRRRPRARLRSPGDPLYGARPARRADRRDRRGPPAADRAAHRAGRGRAPPRRDPRDPHRAPDDAARTRQRPCLRRLRGRSTRSTSRRSCSPTSAIEPMRRSAASPAREAVAS